MSTLITGFDFLTCYNKGIVWLLIENSFEKTGSASYIQKWFEAVLIICCFVKPCGMFMNVWVISLCKDTFFAIILSRPIIIVKILS